MMYWMSFDMSQNEQGEAMTHDEQKQILSGLQGLSVSIGYLLYDRDIADTDAQSADVLRHMLNATRTLTDTVKGVATHE